MSSNQNNMLPNVNGLAKKLNQQDLINDKCHHKVMCNNCPYNLINQKCPFVLPPGVTMQKPVPQETTDIVTQK